MSHALAHLRIGVFSSLSVLLLLPAAALAQTPEIPATVRQTMQDRDYAKAEQAIDAAIKQKDAPVDYLLYLKGRAAHLAGQYDRAIAIFDGALKDHTESSWARRIRFAKGATLARKGDFRGAEAIYEAEAKFLLSLDRQEELAEVFLEFANAYFEPAEKEIAPNYEQALKFYEQALVVGTTTPKQQLIEKRMAECYQKQGNFAEAAKRYEQFLRDHQPSTLEVEVRYQLGACYLAQNQLVEARRVWEDLLAAHADDPSPRIAEAMFRMSHTYGQPLPCSAETLGLAVAALERFLKVYPNHELAAAAHLEIADRYLHTQNFGAAEQRFQLFLDDERYAGRKEIPNARFQLGFALQSQRKFAEAVAIWREFLTAHPTDPGWSEAQLQIVRTEFLIAEQQRIDKNYDEARKLYGEFLARYPLDERAPRILLALGQMHRDQEQWDEAIAAWTRLISKYPNTGEAHNARFLIAVTLEEKQSKYAEAIEVYKKVVAETGDSRAQARLTALTTESFQIATRKTYRTNEVPKIELTSRNLEQVSVRVYSVDLQTYFRKMHLAQGVESLDIRLIDPDQSFEFKIPDFAKHKESITSIPLSLLEADATGGVLAVTVSTKTHEATTMVIQSDLDILVKSSRNELFVFAQNSRTGRPWAGAKLLVSDGKKVFAEVETGEDGVLQKSFDELKGAADVRVFATAAGSVASNVVGLSGLQVARGLTDKGYIYTDRPAYRAGQLVHARGVIRQVAADVYEVSEGAEYRLSVIDPRSRTIWEETVKLNRFGSFFSRFTLPAASPPGDYRIVVDDAATKKQYQGTFLVHEYNLPNVFLTIETPKNVYYRGEEIAGTITARYYHGAPVAGRELEYQLGDGRVQKIKTDKQGAAKFTFPTRELREEQTLNLIARMPQFNIATVAPVRLAIRGFSIALSTVRPVYLAGESFELSVTTSDAEGKPTAQKLQLEVLEKILVAGKPGERPVETRELTTEQKTGVGRATLELKTGGNYLLRVSGTDQFGTTISAAHPVQVSGEEDKIRLRILAQQHTFRAGDTAEVNVHWRDAPALALITHQGARVLDYQLVTLKKGDNKLKIPMSPKLAPNFELAVAVMTDRNGLDESGREQPGQLHEANSPFTVEQNLLVGLKINRKPAAKGPIAPGEEVEVEISATDPQGNPLEAELSLAMIERALIDRFSEQNAPIDQFFRGTTRQMAVRASSSAQFAYQPQTKAINARLLSEAERVEVAARESERLNELKRGDRLAASGGSGEIPDLMPDSDEDGRLSLGDELDELSQVVEEEEMLGENYRQFSGKSFSGRASAKGHSLQRFERNNANGVASNRSQEKRAAINFDFSITRENEFAQLGLQGTTTNSLQLFSETHEFHDRRLAELRTQSAVPSARRDGTFHYYSFLGLSDKETRQQVDLLTRQGEVLLPNLAWQETGYWTPAVVTNSKGKALVQVTLPGRSTSWKLFAKGVTIDSLAGQAEAELSASKPLFAELALPLAFTDGDQADLLATVHHPNIKTGKIRVALKTTIGQRSFDETKEIEASKSGVSQVAFRVTLARGEQAAKKGEPANAPDAAPNSAADRSSNPAINASFELSVASGELRDTLRRTASILPYGEPVYAARSGAATADTTTWIELPAEMAVRDPRLEITIGPTVQRSLLDVVFGPPPWCQLATARYASPLETTTSDILACLGLQELLSASRDAANPQAQALDRRIRSSLGAIVAAQQDDGGFSWTGSQGASNGNLTARVVWSLAAARKAGYLVPDATFDKAVALLQSRVPLTANEDFETKALLFHALATAGRGDFALANRIHRDRASLSPAGLVYLALGFAEMGRKELAADTLASLEKRDLDAASSQLGGQGSLPANYAGTELRALYALALQQSSPESPQLAKLADGLLAARVGQRWAPDKATGPATLALCRYMKSSAFTADQYELSVFVNGNQVEKIAVDAKSPTHSISVPADFLVEGKQRVQFILNGRGRYAFACTLGGFVPADQLKSANADWRVTRYYEPGQLEDDGVLVPRGFGILAGNHTQFRNPITQLPVAKRANVELRIYRNQVFAQTREEQLEYLVVNEPIPAGAAIVESSIQGGFERYEISPGAITFFLGSRPYINHITYQLRGQLPGKFRAAPTVVRDAYRPDRIAVAEPKLLAVLPLGAKSEDAYRLTPEELYALAGRRFQAERYAEAATHLKELLADWNLNPDSYRQSTLWMLDISLAAGPPAEIVKYFEIVKEKWPDVEISFEKILKIGHAYHEIGEYERSYLVFRATVESRFLRESRVAGFLREEGEFVRSVDVMSSVMKQYPPEPYLAAGVYALAQQVFAKAPEAATDESLRRAKLTRVDLVHQALTMLDGFLTEWPADPAADQAAFSLAGGLLELKQFDQAIEACNRFAKRYPDSQYLDSYWYTVGYCHFARGEHAAALEMCRKVAETRRKDPQTGRLIDSRNRWRAIYILGQIYHSLGQAAEAIAEYSRVADRFADAREAIDYFTRREISLPEITTIRPGQPPVVPLGFRNVPLCDVRVYRIDLLTYSLLRRDLSGITSINLAGIQPLIEKEIELGDGKDYRDRTHDLKLPLQDEAAYLVVCRGGDLHASGLVLVSPLVIDVQQEASSGRLRATVRDQVAGNYAANVHLKAIGSGNQDFVSGESDLRGVFVADGLRGTATVIAQAGPSRYAFFRGETYLGPKPEEEARKKSEQQQAEPSAPGGSKGQSQELLEDLFEQNKAIQGQQLKQIDRYYKNDVEGVDASDAF